MAIIFSIFEIFGEREKMANLIFRRKKRICVKNVPIHLFLLPRCENLSPKKKKNKNRLNVLISFISVAKMLKICHKEKHQVQHIYFETYGSKCSNKETLFFFFFESATCLGRCHLSWTCNETKELTDFCFA
jgi:hypothetical protein